MSAKRRSAKESREYFTQPADGVRFVRHDEIHPEPAVSHDEMIQMTKDIAIRLTNTGSVDAVPAPDDFDDAHRQMWNDLLKEIDEIRLKGGIVDLPDDIP
jgi:hypothetical protein|tara:strand:+ start:13605 stop:13904 length:300 start_codon:yes stop_codon:yes gene_type:complete